MLIPHCDLTDVPCHVHAASYPLWESLAKAAWFLNRSLLHLARWLEGLVSYLVTGDESLLGSGFAILGERLTPILYAVAALAVIVFLIGYMLSPVLGGETNWVRPKKAILHGFLAVMLFSTGSAALSNVEVFRMNLSGIMSSIAQDVFGTSTPATFYASADTTLMNVAPIYAPGSPDCRGRTVLRATPEMHLNDIAARFLLADAVDIHCGATAIGLPVAWKDAFLPATETFASSNEADRNEAINLAIEGIWRMMLGLFIGVAAVVEAAMNLLFGLALVLCFFSLALGLIFGLFAPMETMVTGPIKTMFNIIKTSMMTSFGFGLLIALCQQAMSTQSSTAVIGASSVALIAGIVSIKTAFGTLAMAANSASAVAGGLPMAVAGATAGLVRGAVSLGTIAATGGGSLALSGLKPAGAGASAAGASTQATARRRMQTNRTIGQLVGRSQPTYAPIASTRPESKWYDEAFTGPTIKLQPPVQTAPNATEKDAKPTQPMAVQRAKTQELENTAPNTQQARSPIEQAAVTVGVQQERRTTTLAELQTAQSNANRAQSVPTVKLVRERAEQPSEQPQPKPTQEPINAAKRVPQQRTDAPRIVRRAADHAGSEAISNRAKLSIIERRRRERVATQQQEQPTPSLAAEQPAPAAQSSAPATQAPAGQPAQAGRHTDQPTAQAPAGQPAQAPAGQPAQAAQRTGQPTAQATQPAAQSSAPAAQHTGQPTAQAPAGQPAQAPAVQPVAHVHPSAPATQAPATQAPAAQQPVVQPPVPVAPQAAQQPVVQQQVEPVVQQPVVQQPVVQQPVPVAPQAAQQPVVQPPVPVAPQAAQPVVQQQVEHVVQQPVPVAQPAPTRTINVQQPSAPATQAPAAQQPVVQQRGQTGPQRRKPSNVTLSKKRGGRK